jgi:hypothetical protein
MPFQTIKPVPAGRREKLKGKIEGEKPKVAGTVPDALNPSDTLNPLLSRQIEARLNGPNSR